MDVQTIRAQFQTLLKLIIKLLLTIRKFPINFATFFFTNIGIKYANEIPDPKFSHQHFMKNKNPVNMFMAPTDPQESITCIDSLKRKNSSGHDNITSATLNEHI